MFAVSIILTALIFVFLGLAGWVLTESTDYLKANEWSCVVIKSGCISALIGLATGCVEILIAIW